MQEDSRYGGSGGTPDPEAGDPAIYPGQPQFPVAPGVAASAGTAAAYSAPPCSGMAIASLVLGILAILTVLILWVIAPVAILPAVPAVVFGYLAQGKIGRSKGKLGGIALAKAGMILGYVGMGIGAVMVVIWGLFIGGVALFVSSARPVMPMGPVSAGPMPGPPPIATEGEVSEILEEPEIFEAWEDLPEAESGSIFELDSVSGGAPDFDFSLDFQDPANLEVELEDQDQDQETVVPEETEPLLEEAPVMDEQRDP